MNTLFNSFVITGSTNSRFGVVVGIPVNFRYKTLDDVGELNVQVVTYYKSKLTESTNISRII